MCHAEPSAQNVNSKLHLVFWEYFFGKCLKTCRCAKKVKALQEFLWLELIFLKKNKVKNAELNNGNTSPTFVPPSQRSDTPFTTVFCWELVISPVVVTFSLLICA